MTICAVPGCQEHYGCQLRNKGIQVSPKVQPAHGGNWRPTKTPPNKYRGQLMYDERPGGVKMPILKPDGTQLRRHEYDKDSHRIDNIMRSKTDNITA